MNVIIVGTGAAAAELTTYITDYNRVVNYELQLFISGYLEYDRNITDYWRKYRMKRPVLGDIDSYDIKEADHFILGISDVAFRNQMIEKLIAKGAKIAGFIHHTSIIAETAQIGAGNVVYPHCIIGPNAVIGDFNYMTSYSFISHDCHIGNNNFFSTAGLSGAVRVGDNNFFGIRSTVIPNISIGSGNSIQAGMIIDKPIANDTTVFYRYKEKVIAMLHEVTPVCHTDI